MNDRHCVEFLQWALPQLRMRWPGFRKVRKQICKRIDQRIKLLGLADIDAYRAYLATDPSEWSMLDSFCRIPISRFYRDRGVFDYLRNEILPSLAAMVSASGEREVRCWSAGCASGDEVYTLAILWELHVSPQVPDVGLRIVATDSDPVMLDRARRACYSWSSLKDCSREWLSAAFLKSDDFFHLRPDFLQGIDFELQDIRSVMPAGPFHLILCRHLVFTYFDEQIQRDLLQQILAKLVVGGVLVTGKQEPLPMRPPTLAECQPRLGIYRKQVVR